MAPRGLEGGAARAEYAAAARGLAVVPSNRARSRAAQAAVLIALCAISVGCSVEEDVCLICGDGGAGGAPATSEPCGDTGRAFFEAKVHPILDDGVTGEVCAKCHSGAYPGGSGAPLFLGSTTEGAYDALVGDVQLVGAVPGNSRLLTKGAHSGPALTASQQAVVEQWLAIEADERSGDCAAQGGNAAACEEALAAFAGCMTLGDWTGNGMHLIAEQDTLSGPCYSCHGGGMADNYMTQPLSDASIGFGFDEMRERPALRKLVTCSGGEGGQTDVVPSHRWRDKGLDGGHPGFLLGEEHQVALDAWYAAVHAAWEAGPCGP